jgi:hypothetical protein
LIARRLVARHPDRLPGRVDANKFHRMNSDHNPSGADNRYFVLQLNSSGKVERVSSLVCDSDTAALLWAGRLEDGGAFEVWTSTGRVGGIPALQTVEG